jgi:basic membrane protein A
MTRETGSDDGSGPAYRQKLTASDVNRRAVLRSGAALVGATAIAGCTGSQDGDTTTTTTSGGSGEPTDVAIVSSPAGFGDKAFNDLALEGLQNAAQNYNINIQQVEETDQSQYGTVQSRLAESTNPDYDLIVLVGYNHTQALESNASQYSDQRWMLINDYVDQPNVAGYTWANHEMSFQAGVLAGTMTTKELSHAGNSLNPDNATVGFVGGVDGALINAFERAYRAGAKWVDDSVSVRVGYIGNYTDTQTANNIASSQYDAGADIVYHAAAAAGQGVFQAAQDASRFAIGVDADQSKTLPDYQDVIMGSAVKFINEGTRQVAQAVVEGNWEQVNGMNVLGLEQDAVKLVLGQTVGPKLPDAVSQNLKESKQGIVNGDITVPCSASGCQN